MTREEAARIAACWTGELPPPAPSSMPGGISWMKSERDDPLDAARGIVAAVAIMLPAWALLFWWVFA